MKHIATFFLGLLTLGAPRISREEPDPATMIRSKHVAERLHAVSRNVSKGHPKAAELPTRGCKDRDGARPCPRQRQPLRPAGHGQ